MQEHTHIDEEQEEQEDKRFLYISLGIHALVMLLLIVLPLFSYTFPIPEQEGVMISFGNPDIGQGDDRPDVQRKEITPETIASPPVATTEPKTTPKKATPSKDIVTQEQESAISFEKKKKDERARELQLQKQREEQAEREAKQQAIAEAKRKAEEDRRIAEAAAAKEAEYQKKKKQFGDFLGGSGKGSTSTAGNQGDPNGNPDANALTGISNGSGKVGGGLSDRGVVSEPDIHETSQKKGRVVLKVCVDNSGQVTSADFTQRGSTTTDSDLVRIAKDNAKKWRFNNSTIVKQCGTITIDFKLQ